MNYKNITIILFAVAALLQWMVPANMIFKSNKVIDIGKTFRFKVQPVDPAHPFAGRYMALRFTENRTPAKPDLKIEHGTGLYAEIVTKDNQYAGIRDVSLLPFTQTRDYIKITVKYHDPDYIYIEYPFERWYMKESKAIDAEKRLNAMLQDSTSTVYAEVKILNGSAVLQDVIVNNQSISSWK